MFWTLERSDAQRALNGAAKAEAARFVQMTDTVKGRSAAEVMGVADEMGVAAGKQRIAEVMSAAGDVSGSAAALWTEGLSAFYGAAPALQGISLSFPRRSITALIGPSGCGKSTLLRTLNRMNDGIPSLRVEGRVWVEGRNVYGPEVDVVSLRRHVGMVFQQANPFPMSILQNVTWALPAFGIRDRRQRYEIAVRSLERAGLWHEVKDRLDDPAFALSGGQQQRLCIARALAVNPSILLMDEPTSALDPASTTAIESLMGRLREEVTIILVSHNMQQAARVSDYTVFLLDGEVVEHGATERLFRNPSDPRTEDYITGRFG